VTSGAGVAAVVLAAGASRRMGRPKLVLPGPGGTLLAGVARALLASDLDRVVVVVGAEADRVRRGAGLIPDPRLCWVENAAWTSGMASSLRAGLAACGSSEAVLVALGDQPGLDDGRVPSLLAAWRRSRAPLVVPVWGERASHPVLFARALWPALEALGGDEGARTVVRAHWAEAERVPVAGPLRDVDTPDDYARLLAGDAPDEGGLPVPD